MPNPITIAYTPDSDDAFCFDALENGLVTLSGFEFHFVREHMAKLNRDALSGRYGVTAISSVLYPRIADRYAILSVGASVGRGYGPVLVSRRARKLSTLAGRKVGVPGIPTTGWFLLKECCPDAVIVEMPFDRIADAVLSGELAAGVMIHEELLYYPKLGLKKVVDLGEQWCSRHHLPLPVGLSVIRRDLGAETMGLICGAIFASLRYARDNPAAALERVRRFGRGPEGGVTDQFVQMFANEDSQWLAPDVRAALRVLFETAVELGLSLQVPPIDVVEPLAPLNTKGNKADDHARTSPDHKTRVSGALRVPLLPATTGPGAG